ncbi:MAG: YggU family protein [Myxococcales bacterium]|nr:YggU family protein [Myxococcales bacterium]
MPAYLATQRDGRLRLEVWAQPGANRTEIVGLHGDHLKIRLKSPPADGRANQELIRFLAETLALPARAIELVAGHAGRKKSLLLAGIAMAEAAARLGGRGPLPGPEAP